MDHSDLEFLIVQFIHGQLPTEEQTRLRRILAESPEAQRTYEDLRRVWDALDDWQTPEPPLELPRAFSKRLAKAAAESRSRSSLPAKIERLYHGKIRWRWNWNLAGLALAACLAFGVFYTLSNNVSMPLPEQDDGTAGQPANPSVVAVDASVSSGTTEADAHESPASGRPEQAPAVMADMNRLPSMGVFVEELPRNGESSGSATFAVDNFSANIPEINTKHYNTVFVSYESPL